MLPDKAMINVAVVNEGNTIQEASAANGEKVGAFIKAIENIKVEEEALKSIISGFNPLEVSSTV